MESNLVRCPNLCLDGQVKHYPNPNIALYDMVNCNVCKGEGRMTREEADKIEKTL